MTVKFFAMMRERLGTGERDLELADGSTLDDVRKQVSEIVGELAPLLDRSMVMVNQEYADGDHRLSDGDEIAFIPPVSGGSHVRVHAEPLDAEGISASVSDPVAGAVVTFAGVVRDNARDQRVQQLEYEAYVPAAEKQLARIVDEMHERWPLHGIAIEHRTGLLQVGEASVVIAVSSTHRDAAFESTAYAIQRIKEIVPIWKKEFYEDGQSWIGSEADYQREVQKSSAT